MAEKHGSLKVVVYEGLKWHHRQAQEDAKQTRKTPSTKNKAAVSHGSLLSWFKSVAPTRQTEGIEVKELILFVFQE